MHRRTRRALVVLTGAATCVALTALPALPATARPHPPKIRVLDRTVLAPYQLDAARGAVYIGEGGASKVLKYSKGSLAEIASGPTPGDVSGVAVNARGDLAYTSSVGDENGITASTLTIRPKHGPEISVDLLAYETAHNPDSGVHYGIDDPTPCQQAAFEPFGGATYPGLVDSHAYAVTGLGRDAWVVADAGGNDLLKVDRLGNVTTLSVLPRQATTITAATAASLGLPDCVVGAVYSFEPVPTDVEADSGDLVVSLLPGGPEDPSLGARGSVYRVSPAGQAQLLAGGFLGATNVAVAPRGRIYVAELFAGRISVIDHGVVTGYVDLPNVLSLVWSKGGLYAGTIGSSGEHGEPAGPGSLVRIDG